MSESSSIFLIDGTTGSCFGKEGGHDAAVLDHGSKIAQRDGLLTSDVNQRYIMSVLENAVVPPLPPNCTHHFFISKDEKYDAKVRHLIKSISNVTAACAESNCSFKT